MLKDKIHGVVQIKSLLATLAPHVNIGSIFSFFSLSIKLPVDIFEKKVEDGPTIRDHVVTWKIQKEFLFL